MEKKQVLILGSLGMLGQELVRVFSLDPRYTVTGWDKEEVDITDFPLFEKKLQSLQPDIVINATGYNAVDRCEQDDEQFRQALLLNRDVPAFLAEQSVESGFFLVHYSTDYVFDGALEENKRKTGCCGGGCCGAGSSGQVGYNEEAVPNPISRYGESKYLGERRVREKAKHYAIIRLSRLFGRPGRSPQAKQSFFESMLEAAKSKAVVEVIDGERSAFTYAPDLAQATQELIEAGSDSGIYHLTNTESATWYEATLALFRQAAVTTRVTPIAGESLARAAKRPACSVLLNTKRPALRAYTEALKDYLHEKENASRMV